MKHNWPNPLQHGDSCRRCGATTDGAGEFCGELRVAEPNEPTRRGMTEREMIVGLAQLNTFSPSVHALTDLIQAARAYLAVPPQPPEPGSGLADRVQKARDEMATWTPERRANCRLEGPDSVPPQPVPPHKEPPYEPTPEMYVAGVRECGENVHWLQRIWRAMYDAAPKGEPAPNVDSVDAARLDWIADQLSRGEVLDFIQTTAAVVATIVGSAARFQFDREYEGATVREAIDLAMKGEQPKGSHE